MHINIFHTNLGLIVQAKGSNSTHASTQSLLGYKINGNEVLAGQCLYGEVVLLQGVDKIETIERMTPLPREVVSYKLNPHIPESLAKALKPTWDVSEVGTRDWDDGEEVFSNADFNCVSQYYSKEYSPASSEWKAVEFTVADCGTWNIDNLNAPSSMAVTMKGFGDFSDKVHTQTLESLACYNDLERLLVPEFLIHKRPCSLSSETMYKIVRHHIRENIDKSVASITSDYDFCFTVKKRIRKNSPDIVRREQFTAKGKSFRPPRFTTSKVEHREEEIFEMTDAKRRYRGYTPIAPLQAEDLETLVHNLKVYLDGLMAVINAPFKECPHCNGSGVVKG